MNPVSPVVPGSNFDEILVAENQPEYQTLPSVHCGNGVMLSRWKLSDEELKIIIETKSIYLYIHTFGNPVQPVLLDVATPFVIYDSSEENKADEKETNESDGQEISQEVSQEIN